MPARTRWKVSLFLIVGAFALRLLFIDLSLPSADPHDEMFHYSYAAFIAETGRIPRAREPSVSMEALRALWLHRPGAVDPSHWDRQGAGPLDDRRVFAAPNYQTQHPPLFYLPAAAILRASGGADLDTRIFLLRLFAAFCAIFAIPAGYCFFRRLLPRPTALAATVALVALPGVASLVGRFTNDALALPLVAVLLLLLVDLSRGRLGAGSSAGLGLVLAAGCWTKLSFLPFLGVPLLAAVAAKRDLRRTVLLRAAAATLLAAVLFAPWLVRQRRDTGDWLGLTPTKGAVAASVTGRDRLETLPLVGRSKYWVVFGRTFLWAGTGTAMGAPAVPAVVLTAALLLVWASPIVSAGVPSLRVHRGSMTALAALALFLLAEIAYTNTFAAVARARAAPYEPYGLGWYAAILTPVVIVAGCVAGRPVSRSALAVLVGISLAASWIIDLGVLPAVYSGRIGFNGANAPLTTYLRGVVSPLAAMRTYAAAGLVSISSTLLVILWAAWQASLGLAFGLGARIRRR